MKKPKSLGQIAYEATDTQGQRLTSFTWETLSLRSQATYTAIAAAVARAVRRRGQGKT